ncbi:MAG: hypothetical protein K2I06_12300 [Ruminococcus sp.]|nr:hypothetical protein [Ruminococcus sp.]
MDTILPVLTLVWDQFATCVDMIVARPYMLIPFAIGIAGAILGLAKGFFRFGRRRR